MIHWLSTPGPTPFNHTPRPKKLKERKAGENEKEGSPDDPLEQLDENRSNLLKKRNIHNSLNSLSSIGSGGGKEEDGKKEEDDSSKDSLIETMSNDSRGNNCSNNEVETSSSHKEKEKEISNQNSKKTGPRGELHLVEERTGASSPSPSVGQFLTGPLHSAISSWPPPIV